MKLNESLIFAYRQLISKCCGLEVHIPYDYKGLTSGTYKLSDLLSHLLHCLLIGNKFKK